jgi:type VI secretion system protein ImpB
MGKEGSVAPQERVNIVYRPALGDAKEEIELPLKLLMLGDFTQREDERTLEDRKPINIDKDNFNDVMKNMKLELDVAVQDKLRDDAAEGDQMAAKLKFESMKDFEPEAIANQVPELQKLLELRKALNSLKGPMANSVKFRKKINELLADDAAREKLMSELGLNE